MNNINKAKLFPSGNKGFANQYRNEFKWSQELRFKNNLSVILAILNPLLMTDICMTQDQLLLWRKYT